YQVDAGDADPATFFYCLGREVARGQKGRPLPLLTPEDADDVPGFTRRFFRELVERLPRSSVLVFDDVQEGGRRFAALVRDGLAEVNAGLRVFLVGRDEPGAELVRLRAAPRVQRVGWDDLRLRPSESEAVARLLGHSRRLGRAFHGRSAGWMAGLVLLLGGGSTATWRLQLGSREDALASLAAEIPGRLPAADRDPPLP